MKKNMKNSLYILQWGEQVCAKTMCDANDRLCTQEEFVLAARTPETPGICPEYPAKYPECPDLLHRTQKTASHHNLKTSHYHSTLRTVSNMTIKQF
jgi:hypothetical protein